ncbi:MAG: hypothetical protein ACXV8R_14215 [Acidimicrobiia bacterium]
MRGWKTSWWVVGLVVIALSATACRPFGHHGWPGNGDGSAHGATGYFHTTFDGHRWWLVTPDGRPFYSTGINHVTADNDTDRVTGVCPYCQAVAANYPNVDAWTDTTVRRLRSWGINTIGSWSDVDRFAPRMPYTYLLSMASTNDWFSDEFAANAASIAASTVVARRDDPNLIGWVTDSELRWGPDWRGQSQLLDDYEQLPPGSPGRAVADQHVGDPIGFLRVLAERYFRVTTEAIHAQDPHHLILGVKQISQLTPPEVLEAARPYVDVFSVDDYALTPGLADQIHAAWPMYLAHDPSLSAIYGIVHRPLMVMEYSFRAADAGVPNSYPPIFPTLPTQQARADAFAGYVQGLYATPWVVGDQWFEYVDEPAGGRFDGEDSNFGLVSTADAPWSTLVARMTEVHTHSPAATADRYPECWSWRRTDRNQVRCEEPARSG